MKNSQILATMTILIKTLLLRALLITVINVTLHVCTIMSSHL